MSEPPSATPAEAGSLLDRCLARAPARRAIDLGCGDASTARRLAATGFEVVGIDASEAALDRAQSTPLPGGVELVLGDMGAVERLVRGQYGAALCLGNTVAYLLSPESLARMFGGLRRRLLPHSPVVLELANYACLAPGEDHRLPLVRHETADGAELHVRLVEPRGDGIFIHRTAVLAYRPAGQPIFELVASRAHQLRGWTREELETVLDVARFTPRGAYGDLDGEEFDPATSERLVLVAD